MNPIVRKTGFQKKVVTAILLVGVVSVALGLASVYFIGRASLEANIGATYQELAEVTAGTLEKELYHHLEEARILTLAGNVIRGPALVERTDTTIFVTSSYTATVDGNGSCVLQMTREG